MSNLTNPEAEVVMTLQITRAATGKTETVEMRGYTKHTPEQLRELGINVQVAQPTTTPKE